jgi:diguanylate cyclase (GGDEF)-like protein
MPGHLRIRLLVFGAVAMIAAAVWLAGDRQRVAADRAFAELAAAETMQTAMQDQESGLSGYLNSRRPIFFSRYERGDTGLEAGLVRAAEGVTEGETDEQAAIATQRTTARRWQAIAAPLIAGAQAGKPRQPGPRTLVRLDDAMGDFRRANVAFRHDLLDERRVNQSRAGVLTVALIVLLGGLFSAFGYLVFERRARRDQRRREQHSRFADVLQLARTEPEAHGVLKRYLEQVVRGGTATVLNRNNSANRLEPTTEVCDESLRDALVGAEPQACMAIRGGRTYRSQQGGQDLMCCEVCGEVGTNVTCVPSLVGGTVIGSVLLEHPRSLGDGDVQHITSSIAEAAPVLANMRNLAIAEFRAATDGLTGLANSRSIRESLARMVAQAGRTFTSMSAVMFDLDHFKQINDGYGHERGDELLGAVGDLASSAVRASDVVGRYGGEEFLALLPSTDRDGALEAAEKLRRAISALSISGLPQTVTASFGVAVYPDDAVEPDELLRKADRALYKAKAAGRNRVEALDEVERQATPPAEPSIGRAARAH